MCALKSISGIRSGKQEPKKPAAQWSAQWSPKSSILSKSSARDSERHSPRPARNSVGSERNSIRNSPRPARNSVGSERNYIRSSSSAKRLLIAHQSIGMGSSSDAVVSRVQVYDQKQPDQVFKLVVPRVLTPGFESMGKLKVSIAVKWLRIELQRSVTRIYSWTCNKHGMRLIRFKDAAPGERRRNPFYDGARIVVVCDHDELQPALVCKIPEFGKKSNQSLIKRSITVARQKLFGTIEPDYGGSASFELFSNSFVDSQIKLCESGTDSEDPPLDNDSGVSSSCSELETEESVWELANSDCSSCGSSVAFSNNGDEREHLLATDQDELLLEVEALEAKLQAAVEADPTILMSRPISDSVQSPKSGGCRSGSSCNFSRKSSHKGEASESLVKPVHIATILPELEKCDKSSKEEQNSKDEPMLGFWGLWTYCSSQRLCRGDQAMDSEDAPEIMKVAS